MSERWTIVSGARALRRRRCWRDWIGSPGLLALALRVYRSGFRWIHRILDWVEMYFRALRQGLIGFSGYIDNTLQRSKLKRLSTVTE